MKEYKLNVDPRILELLGPHLYTNIYYVLAELIANAYDADAKNVYIIEDKDYIRVEDDGHGMSYSKGEINSYLNVAGISRINEEDSLTRSQTRRKMGRKGVGKLAALSVSENVDVLTIADGEQSGFVLSRSPEEGNKLKAIPDGEVRFNYISTHGTAIVMRNPQYKLHNTLAAVKRNLLKIFPLVNSDFRIHIINGKQTTVIDDFDKNIMSELSTLITLGDEFEHLAQLVPNDYPKNRSRLVVTKDEKNIPIKMKNNAGIEKEYDMKIKGWIGTYKSTRGRKSSITDFPDNFISLFANKKLGEFNILPVVGKNKLNEVYVVGQLHVDLFELTELPDMALSNRQGYKSDDERYQKVRNYISNSLLPDILRMREIYSDIDNAKKKKKKEESLKEEEKRLKDKVNNFRLKASKEAATNLAKIDTKLSKETIEKIVAASINKNSPDLGLKAKIDSQKKKILISHTRADKNLADLIYQTLLFNRVPAEDILYTSCDEEVSRIPEGCKTYEYLRNFFVESYSDQKIYVLFVTSESMRASWGAITEVGASWITRVNHKIFNIQPFRPEHPLDDESIWQTTNRDDNNIWMTRLDMDIFCSKIERVCDDLGYKKKTRQENKNYVESSVEIRD